MRTVTSTSTTNQISSSSALTVILHQKAEYDSALERAKPMDEDLAKITCRALDEAKAAGRDHTAQTEQWSGLTEIPASQGLRGCQRLRLILGGAP